MEAHDWWFVEKDDSLKLVQQQSDLEALEEERQCNESCCCIAL